MSDFETRCGVHDDARELALQQTCARIRESGVELVRVSWGDLHGIARSKTLVASAVEGALRPGVGMVSTLMLKDISGRTVYPVFEPGGTEGLPGFGQANNLILLPDPQSFQQLPWADATGWLRAQPWFANGQPVELDPRRVLRRALQALRDRGMGMRCGLEVEFHIYRIDDVLPSMDPEAAAPHAAPAGLSLVHPGGGLLSEAAYDRAEAPLRIVQRTAQALGMPLLSLEAELGPSQVEAVFDLTDALTAADNMALFRNAVKMALQRAGYHATFMCRPPFPNIMSSGWHLHQSLVNLEDERNLFCRERPALGSGPCDAGYSLSKTGEHDLAGLLEHALGTSAICTPTMNGYDRFRPNALAPRSVLWGRDSRGAMLRVIGECGDRNTRIENRIGEPAASPYLYVASQIYAGLDGIQRELKAPPATDAPYGAEAVSLPASLAEALKALQDDAVMTGAFGRAFVDHYVKIKTSEVTRFEAAEDKTDFCRSEYFDRI